MQGTALCQVVPNFLLENKVTCLLAGVLHPVRTCARHMSDMLSSGYFLTSSGTTGNTWAQILRMPKEEVTQVRVPLCRILKPALLSATLFFLIMGARQSYT